MRQPSLVACLLMWAQILSPAATGAAADSINSWDCTARPGMYAVLQNASGVPFVGELDPGSGKYTPVFTLPHSYSDDSGSSNITYGGCDISPNTHQLFCLVRVFAKNYLAQVSDKASEGMGYVRYARRVSDWAYRSDSTWGTFFHGAFDADGAFWVTSMGAGAVWGPADAEWNTPPTGSVQYRGVESLDTHSTPAAADPVSPGVQSAGNTSANTALIASGVTCLSDGNGECFSGCISSNKTAASGTISVGSTSECADDSSFTDSEGEYCDDWDGYDCFNYGLPDTYTPEQLAAVRAACPQACNLCMFYTGKTDCAWIIHAPPGHVIELNFDYFDIMSYSSSYRDYIKLYRCSTPDCDVYDYVGSFTGTTEPAYPATISMSGFLKVIFDKSAMTLSSDKNEYRKGFSASWKVRPITEVTRAELVAWDTRADHATSFSWARNISAVGTSRKWVPSTSLSLTWLPRLTAGVVSFEADLTGTGVAPYLAGLWEDTSSGGGGGHNVMLVLWRTDTTMTTVIAKSSSQTDISPGSSAFTRNWFSAAWNMQGRLFFADAQNRGLYEVSISQAQFDARDFTLRRVGRAYSRPERGVPYASDMLTPSMWTMEHGFNCPNAPALGILGPTCGNHNGPGSGPVTCPGTSAYKQEAANVGCTSFGERLSGEFDKFATTITKLCTSSDGTEPQCEVVFSDLDPQETFNITIEIGNTDFSSSGEYVSAVIVGGQTIGTKYLDDGGSDKECSKMSKILDAQSGVECTDDSSFTDSEGEYCDDWDGYDCFNYGLPDTYTPEQLAAVRAACPQACNLCMFYTGKTDCAWIIHAPPGHVIELNFDYFDIMSYSSSYRDYIKLYRCSTPDCDVYDYVGSFTGTTEPAYPATISMSGFLKVIFDKSAMTLSSDKNEYRKGFSASWKVRPITEVTRAELVAWDTRADHATSFSWARNISAVGTSRKWVPSTSLSLTWLPRLTAGVVSFEADLTGTGVAPYLAGLWEDTSSGGGGGHNVMLVLWRTDTTMTTVIAKSSSQTDISPGSSAFTRNWFSAAWNMQGRLFFADAQNRGLYEVSISQAQFDARDFTLRRVGRAYSRPERGVPYASDMLTPSMWTMEHGFNCPNAPALGILGPTCGNHNGPGSGPVTCPGTSAYKQEAANVGCTSFGERLSGEFDKFATTITKLCTSSDGTEPQCEVVFSDLDPQETFNITIEIGNTDFSSSGEYVSAVIVGGQTIGTKYLDDGGSDKECSKMSKILDAQSGVECTDDSSFTDLDGDGCGDWDGYDCFNSDSATTEQLAAVRAACPRTCNQCVPAGVVNVDGELTVRIETFGVKCSSSSGYLCNDGSCLYARVTIGRPLNLSGYSDFSASGCDVSQEGKRDFPKCCVPPPSSVVQVTLQLGGPGITPAIMDEEEIVAFSISFVQGLQSAFSEYSFSAQALIETLTVTNDASPTRTQQRRLLAASPRSGNKKAAKQEENRPPAAKAAKATRTKKAALTSNFGATLGSEAGITARRSLLDVNFNRWAHCENNFAFCCAGPCCDRAPSHSHLDTMGSGWEQGYEPNLCEDDPANCDESCQWLIRVPTNTSKVLVVTRFRTLYKTSYLRLDKCSNASASVESCGPPDQPDSWEGHIDSLKGKNLMAKIVYNKEYVLSPGLYKVVFWTPVEQPYPGYYGVANSGFEAVVYPNWQYVYLHFEIGAPSADAALAIKFFPVLLLEFLFY